MSKKAVLITFSLLVVALFMLTGCGDGTANGEGAAAAGRDVRLIMATGGVAGTYYPLGGAMATVINNNTLGINITITSSGASADNIRQIGDGDASVAIVQNDVMYYAFTGTEIWSEEAPITNMGTLMSLYPETVHIVTLADSGIYSVADLAGYRVSVGALGSGVMANATQVLNAYGLTIDDLNAQFLNFADSSSAMQDLNLDAFFVTSATPNTGVYELSRNRDLRIVPLSEAGIAHLMNNYEFYVRVNVTSDDYHFVTEPVPTVAVQATLIASLDVADDVAYDIVRALIENASEVEEGHARGAYITLENASVPPSVPFHPGAARFFEARR